MGLPWPGRLLLLLLLAATPCPGHAGGSCPEPCRCQQRLLDCSHAALVSVPPASRRRAFSVLDFTGNSISSLENQAWKDYLWAEYLVLQYNDLWVVNRRSLEGLFLLKHLDLSCNKILSIEEHAFEPLPFLQLLNLGGNLITQIQNSTFQAWHGMQFLQKLILSHNPLFVIADTSFFKLPSVKYLDLGATQLTQQALLMLLLTTVHLETLKLPSDVACCLCQKKHPTKPPCRTIKFHCENLCTTSAPQCAYTDPLAETPGKIMEVLPSRKLKASMVLNLKPEDPLLRDNETITFAVVLNLTGTDGDLGNANDHISRTNSCSSQQLLRQGDKTSKELMLHNIQHMDWTIESHTRRLDFLAKALEAELKNKLHKAESIMTVTSTVSPLPTSAMQKDEVHKIPAVEGEPTTGWVQKQHGLGLDQTAANPQEAAGRLNPTDNTSIFRHHKISTAPSKHTLLRSPAEAPHLSRCFNNQNCSKAVEQTKKTHGMEDVEDAEDVGDAEDVEDAKDAEEAPRPRQDYVWTYKKQKQRDSPYLNKSNQLFSKTSGNVTPEEEPTPTESKAEQKLNTEQHFFYNLLVNYSPPTASSMLEDTGEEEGSSLGRHLPAVPQTAETHWKQPKEGSSFLSKPGSSDSPDSISFQGDLFETKVNHYLGLLVSDEALQMFIAHVARALRMDCSLPEVQLPCAKMISRMGLLVKLLSERQDDQGDSVLVGHCLLEGNVSNSMPETRKVDRKSIRKQRPKHALGDNLLLALSATLIIMINFTAFCLIEVCSQNPEAASQPQRTSQSHPKWFFQKLPEGQSESECGIGEQGSHVSCFSQTQPWWLRDLYQPLEAHHMEHMSQLYDLTSEEEEEVFSKSRLNRMPPAPQSSHTDVEG